MKQESDSRLVGHYAKLEELLPDRELRLWVIKWMAMSAVLHHQITDEERKRSYMQHARFT